MCLPARSGSYQLIGLYDMGLAKIGVGPGCLNCCGEGGCGDLRRLKQHFKVGELFCVESIQQAGQLLLGKNEVQARFRGFRRGSLYKEDLAAVPRVGQEATTQ